MCVCLGAPIFFENARTFDLSGFAGISTARWIDYRSICALIDRGDSRPPGTRRNGAGFCLQPPLEHFSYRCRPKLQISTPFSAMKTALAYSFKFTVIREMLSPHPIA